MRARDTLMEDLITVTFRRLGDVRNQLEHLAQLVKPGRGHVTALLMRETVPIAYRSVREATPPFNERPLPHTGVVIGGRDIRHDRHRPRRQTRCQEPDREEPPENIRTPLTSLRRTLLDTGVEQHTLEQPDDRHLPGAQEIIEHQDWRLGALARCGIGHPGDTERVDDTCYVNNVAVHIDLDFITCDLLEICDQSDNGTHVSYLGVIQGCDGRSGWQVRWQWFDRHKMFFEDTFNVFTVMSWFRHWCENTLTQPKDNNSWTDGQPNGSVRDGHGAYNLDDAQHEEADQSAPAAQDRQGEGL
jgi:hypothetical protein